MAADSDGSKTADCASPQAPENVVAFPGASGSPKAPNRMARMLEEELRRVPDSVAGFAVVWYRRAAEQPDAGEGLADIERYAAYHILDPLETYFFLISAGEWLMLAAEAGFKTPEEPEKPSKS